VARRMKRVVVSSGLHEADIRPPALMSEFKRLSIQDALEYFGDASALVEVDCPACGATARQPEFRKNEFLYDRCLECGSVFVSPRPTEAALANYYAQSRASRFRVEHFSRDTAKARRYHLLRSHANWMGQITDETGNPQARRYADINTYAPQVFDEVHRLGLFDELFSVEPLLPLDEECTAPVTCVSLDGLTGMGAISAFEKIEHQFSPAGYIAGVRAALADDGLFFFTTRAVTGFDLQVLWDKTPYIFVPEHLNLLSIEGITRLLERCGLDLVELSTPGQLDVEFVQHAIEQDPSIRVPPFVAYLLRHRDPLAHADLQAFLQKHRLSSHVRVAAKKGKDA